MPSATKGSADLALIAELLERAREGQGFAGFEFEDAIMVVAAAWRFPDEVAPSERRHLASKAVFAAAKKEGAITAQRLKSELHRVAQDYMKVDPKPFVLTSSIALPARISLPRARLDGNTITFSPRLPSRFSRDPISWPPGLPVVRDDARYLKVRVHVRARTPPSGYESGMASLDFMRGCLNFSLNRRLWRGWGGAIEKPMNRILPGPVHTLHTPNGKLATKVFWYEPFFNPDSLPGISARHRRQIEEAWPTVRRLCSSANYSANLKRGMIRYARALDLRPQHAFTRLWGLIEYLTDTTHGRSEDTIRRLAFLFEDTGVHTHVLRVLRDSRNRSVHSDSEDIGHEDLVRLHSYAARLISFLMMEGRTFESIAEAGEFLSLPVDAGSLVRRSEVLRRALRFRGVSASDV